MNRMFKVSNLLFILMMLVSGFFIPKVIAYNYSSTVNSPVNKGIANYIKLAAPTDISQPSNRWIIYFGPTQEQANASIVAASKRKYVQKRSPLQAIPTLIVNRTVIWITLSTNPDQQITDNNTNTTVGTQTNPYGY